MSNGTRRAGVSMHHHGPASPELASRLRRQLIRWARSEGIPADTTYDVGLACYEAMANTVRHAYPTGTVGPLELHARLASGALVVTVADRGRWAGDHAAGVRPGHGLDLIHKLCPDTKIVPGDYGTTVRMSWPRRAA